MTPLAELAFQNSGMPFVVAGVAESVATSLLAEADLDSAIGRNATIGVSYTGQLARNLHDHVKGKFSGTASALRSNASSQVIRSKMAIMSGCISRDLEQRTLQPLDNPFGGRVSPMS